MSDQRHDACAELPESTSCAFQRVNLAFANLGRALLGQSPSKQKHFWLFYLGWLFLVIPLLAIALVFLD